MFSCPHTLCNCTFPLSLKLHNSRCTYQRSSREKLSGGTPQTHFLAYLNGSKGLRHIKDGVIACFSSYQSVIQPVSQSSCHASGLSRFRYRPSCGNTPFLPSSCWALIFGHEHHHLLKHMRSLSHQEFAEAQNRCHKRLDNIKILLSWF